MNKLSIKNINQPDTQLDSPPVNTSSQAIFESAMEYGSAAERRQKRELQRSYLQHSYVEKCDTKKHPGVKKCRQALSCNNQDYSFLPTSLMTVQNNAALPSSVHKKPIGLSKYSQFQSQVNSRYDRADQLPARSKGLQSLIKNGRARIRRARVQPENQSPTIPANSIAIYKNNHAKFLPVLVLAPVTSTIPATSLSVAKISGANTSANNSLPSMMLYIEKSSALTEPAPFTPLSLITDTKAAAEAAASAMVPFTPGDHLLAQLNGDNSLLTEVEPQLSELIEHLAMKIQTTVTTQGSNAQFQITLPQLGIVDVNITLHAGELQIAIGSLPEIQKQLLRSHNELLERLQRLNPAQTVSLSFDNQSGFEQGSRQRRYVHEEWEHG